MINISNKGNNKYRIIKKKLNVVVKLKFVCVFGSFVWHIRKTLKFSVFVRDSFLYKMFIYHFHYHSH